MGHFWAALAVHEGAHDQRPQVPEKAKKTNRSARLNPETFTVAQGNDLH